MAKPADIKTIGATLYFIPIDLRVPLKFGTETMTFVTCARVKLTVTGANGKQADGWGETPLSVTWVWPSSLSYENRHDTLKNFCITLAEAWSGYDCGGHPLEIGNRFQEDVLPKLQKELNDKKPSDQEGMPLLAALVCNSLFDIALHDAYGNLLGKPIYKTYNADYMTDDLSQFIIPNEGSDVSFAGKYPQDFLTLPPPETLPAWHLVGGLDPITESELTGNEPDDDYPVLLEDWIKRDGLQCLKVKLRGNDAAWDYDRTVKVGEIAIKNNVPWLTADFNCTVTDPDYVNKILDQLIQEHPRIYGSILYIEQPFPYEIEENRIDVHSVSARKPLFMDESAHNWHLVKLGYQLGWTGVALKTCKTQTGALLSLCWAKAHGMTLMVQDLTNPMLAQIPHVQLAAHVGTIMGVETNSMQFYPDASLPEEEIHPGIYRRREGVVNLSSLSGPGFGYRLDEIKRTLPEPTAGYGVGNQ